MAQNCTLGNSCLIGGWKELRWWRQPWLWFGGCWESCLWCFSFSFRCTWVVGIVTRPNVKVCLSTGMKGWTDSIVCGGKWYCRPLLPRNGFSTSDINNLLHASFKPSVLFIQSMCVHRLQRSVPYLSIHRFYLKTEAGPLEKHMSKHKKSNLVY